MSHQGSVLVADDDTALLRAYSRALASAGFEVVSAESGKAAIEQFRGRSFDAVLSDVAMPGLNGLQLLHTIRERDLDVPVLLITGGPSIEAAMQAVEEGAFRYLQKPVALDDLTSVIGKAVGVGRLARLKREVLTEANQVGDRASLQVKFDSALEKLWMAYQPIVRWSTRETYAHEALVRSAECALPHPGALFDAADHLGQTLRLVHAIRAASPAPMTGAQALLFHNLHTMELEDDTLFAPDMPLVREAHRTVLEITERVSLDAVKDVRGRIASLRHMGFRIALDDIGAGYSGLSSFALLEPDVVKIDMSLVRDVQLSPLKQKLIRSMTGLCEGMGTVVVAEGVETCDELRTLVDLGCDYFQGFLFARPGKPFPSVAWPEA